MLLRVEVQASWIDKPHALAFKAYTASNKHRFKLRQLFQFLMLYLL